MLFLRWLPYHGQIWDLCQQVTQPRDRPPFFDGVLHGVLSNTQMPSPQEAEVVAPVGPVTMVVGV